MNRRFEYLDLAKGIAIILVVFGHTITKNMAENDAVLQAIRTNIYWLHMPSFFAVSGILFGVNRDRYKKGKPLEYIRKKAVTFLVPYVTFSLLSYVIFEFITRISLLAPIAEKTGYVHHTVSQFVFSALTYINPVDDHLWFLYVMFAICCLSRILISCETKYVIPVIVVLNAVLLYLDVPEVVWKTVRYAIVFYVGAWWQEHNTVSKKTPLKLLSAAVVFIALVILNTVLRNNDAVWYRSITYPLCFVSGAYVTVSLSAYMCESMSESKTAFVRMLGVNSYPIYLIHLPFLVNGMVFILNHLGLNNYLIILISGVMGIAIPLLLYKHFLSRFGWVKLILFGNH